MDKLQQAYYEKCFIIEFHQTKGDAFQALVEKLMGLAYKEDFMACRPWGNVGDKKNDGFLKSEKRLLQVYAPNEMTAAKAKKKISEDFEGAKTHWGTHFDKWTFVHNAKDGLPPHVQKLLLDFEKANPGITIQPWGLEELLLIFRKLSSKDLESWFGPAPSEESSADLGFSDLQLVLQTIADKPEDPRKGVSDVPKGKIEANALSSSVAILLKAGMAKAPLVEEFFGQWHDDTLGERVAESFRSKYQTLRGTLRPDEIFAELESWASGSQKSTAKHMVAVLAILAYYFGTCDIFEEPPKAAK